MIAVFYVEHYHNAQFIGIFDDPEKFIEVYTAKVNTIEPVELESKSITEREIYLLYSKVSNSNAKARFNLTFKEVEFNKLLADFFTTD